MLTREFETGAVRSGDAEDFRYDLITPIGMAAVAAACANADEKYADCKSVPLLLNECLRQTYLFLSGSRDAPHLAKAALAIMYAVQECSDDKTQ